MRTIEITKQEADHLLGRAEDHYLDFKSKDIKPASLEKLVSAFGNSSGGEIIIGVDESASKGAFSWSGFGRPEEANQHVEVLLGPFPESDVFQYDILTSSGREGVLLRVTVGKTRTMCATSSGAIYTRGVASVERVETDEQMRVLALQKGITSHEDATTRAPIEMITDSLQVTEFVIETLTFTEPEPWLRNQLMIVEDRPTVAGVVLFADEPQIVLPKASVMVYRYGSRSKVGEREDLADNRTWNIEGSAMQQIAGTVAKTTELIESVKGTNLQDIVYPRKPFMKLSQTLLSIVTTP